jgi:hypothetical protein
MAEMATRHLPRVLMVTINASTVREARTASNSNSVLMTVRFLVIIKSKSNV